MDIYITICCYVHAFGSHFIKEIMVIDSWKLNGVTIYI